MALHPQRSAEAGSQSDILHQPTILSSATTHQPLLTSLLAKNARWPSLREQFRRPQALPVRFWPLHRHQTPPHSEGNKQLLFHLLTIMHPLLITLFGILRYSCRRHRLGRHPRNCFSNISNSSDILLVHPPFSSIHLTFVFSNQIQRLPSKRARTIASPVQVA